MAKMGISTPGEQFVQLVLVSWFSSVIKASETGLS